MNSVTTIIGVDPSMTATGIGVIRDGSPIYVTTVPLTSIKKEEKGEQLVARIQKLFKVLDKTVTDYGCDLMVVERTDWMRNLSGRTEWKKDYAIERRNQEALALLQGALAAYCLQRRHEFMLVGVNEWHKEYGAGNKDAVMMLLHQEFPNEIETADDAYWWIGDGEKIKMNNNETDALGIALVGYNRFVHKQSVRDMAA